MWRIRTLLQLGIAAVVLASLLAGGQPAPARADTANVPSLVISQLKITSSNGQFITLYNATGRTLDMSQYQLEYFNNYDLSKSTSSKLIGLSGIVPPHGYFMINDDALTLCYRLTVDSVSLGLSSTAGLVEVLSFSQGSPGGSASPSLEDYVGWSKAAAAGAQTLPSNSSAFLQRQPVDVGNNPTIGTAGSGSWQAVQPDSSNACNLVSASGPAAPVQTGFGALLPPTEPPVTILALNNDSPVSTAPTLPITDLGLMAPEVTELLPNPDGTGNDASDEFIEAYNPNSVNFDLSGFALQTGTTSLHHYTFPTATTVPPHSFTAFYSATTGLSLSNSGGQVKLLDPFGNSISATAVYGTAKDGQAWALANSKWYWTTKLTPGAANIINQPSGSKKSAATSKKSTKTKALKGTKAAQTKLTGSQDDSAAITAIHSWTLALIVGLALLYGAYEYRADLKDRVYRLRRYLRTRRSDRT